MGEALRKTPPSELLTANERIDELEARMLDSGKVIDAPLVHRFTPGLYAREIFMPAGSLVTSKIHKTEHPYVISKGRCSVWIDGTGWVHLEAPFCGITKPGTRRVLLIHEDTVWTTFHVLQPGEEGDLDKIEQRIIERRELPDGTAANDHYKRLLAESQQGQIEEGGIA